MAEDNKPGLWGFAFDLLWEKSKVKLTDDQKNRLIEDLENRLDRLVRPSPGNNIDPWAAEPAARRLASCYRKLGSKDDVQRLLLDLGGAFEKMASKASALQAMAWMEHVHSLYLEFGLNDDAERIAVKIQQLGPESSAEMKPVSATVNISQKEMDEYVASFSGGSLEEMLALIASRFIPRKEEIKEQLKKHAQEAPLMFLLSSKLQDGQGRPIASVGPLEIDLDGNVVRYMSQNLAASAVFLREVMKECQARSETVTKDITAYAYKSPILEDSKRAIIEQGLDDYFAGRYMSAVHLLLPQIEDAMRVLLQKSGGSVFKPNRTGGFDMKLLNELLREQKVLEVFGEDMTLYLRVLIADPRGWNLRNSVCHGLLPADAFRPEMADRVVHALLCLAQIREKQTPPADQQNTNGSVER